MKKRVTEANLFKEMARGLRYIENINRRDGHKRIADALAEIRRNLPGQNPVEELLRRIAAGEVSPADLARMFSVKNGLRKGKRKPSYEPTWEK